MESRWVERDADAIVARYAEQGIAADVAFCIYATRLIGSDPRLVLHGGGNTSVKTFARDLVGEKVAVLRIKGSGGDMAAIEPAGSTA
jgi:rhamnose utilization protein RhaD (predicted bifunctional aldolase and dehydrogenase)